MAPAKGNYKSKKNAEIERSESGSETDFPASILPKTGKTRHPEPGSPDFENLKPVNISPGKAALASVSRKLSFGNMEEESVETAPLRSPALLDSEKRTRKPSQKAAYMASNTGDSDSDVVEVTPKTRKVPTAKTGKGKKPATNIKSDSSEVELVEQNLKKQDPKGKKPVRTKNSDSSDVEFIPSPRVKAAETPRSSQASPSKKRKQQNRSPSAELTTPKPPKANEAPAGKRIRLVPFSPKAPPPAPDSVDIPLGKTPKEEKRTGPAQVVPLKSTHDVSPPREASPYPTSDFGEQEADERTTSEQENAAENEVDDRYLQAIYSTLPKHNYCYLIPFAGSASGRDGNNGLNNSTLLSYSLLVDELPKLTARNFKNSVNFNGFGRFINPTRDDIARVQNEKGRLVVVDSKRTAILMTTGLVEECHLHQPTYTKDGMNRVKKVMVYPLAYEYQRLVNWLGNRVGKAELYAQVSPDVAITFSSRKEATSKGSGSSPVKSGRFFVTAKGPSSSNVPTVAVYPNYRNFTDDIPIYDCREVRFKFDDNAFNSLHTLPKVDSDLPPESLVSVGYTANPFPYAPSATDPKTEMAIHFNVLFVLYFGALPEKKGSESD